MNEYLKTKFDGANLGGLRSVRIIRMVDIISMPAMNSVLVDFDSIQLATGAEFQDIYFTLNTGYYHENEVKTAAGRKYEKEVGFEIPKIRPEILEALEKYQNCKNAILATDRNQINYLVFPLEIERKRHIFPEISQKNGISIILKGESTNESPVLTNVPSV